MHRPLNPRGASVAIDANSLDRVPGREALVDRLLALDKAGELRLIVPHGVRREVQHPRTPGEVQKPALGAIFTLKTALAGPERKQLDGIKRALQGNAAPGKHDADAQHLFEAGKYCSYFITHDDRILKRADGLGDLLPASLTVVTLAEFFEIFDNYPER